MKEYYIMAIDELPLSIVEFEKDNPKAVIQVIHGAKEHKGRYFEFAKWLNQLGYAVVLSDNRGHGTSVNSNYPLGHMDGWEELVEDQYVITKHIKESYPDKPLYMFTHSFGSLIARCYLQKYDTEIQKLILSGAPNYINLVNLGLALGRAVIRFSGKHGRTQLLQQLGDKDDYRWICGNQEVIDNFGKDPLCTGYKYTNGAIYTIWAADKQMHEFKNYPCRNKKLQILSITGVNDPVSGGTKGLKDTQESLRKIGYTNYESIVYPDMKHEVINEAGKDKVYMDIKNFLEC